MGYIKKKIGDISNVPYVTFECDTVADLAAIDVSNVVMGSRCYVVDTGATYALNSDGEWKEVPIGGGVSSWNDLEDKPFYEETVTNVIPGLNITWDGNTSGLPSAAMGRTILYRVSELTPTLEQLQTATVVFKDTTGGEDVVQQLSDATITVHNEQGLVLKSVDYIAVQYVEVDDTPPGLYFPVGMGGMIYCSSITAPEISETVSEVKTIDKKFLPGHLQFGEVAGFAPKTITLNASGENSCWGNDLEIAKGIAVNPENVVLTYYNGYEYGISSEYTEENNNRKYLLTRDGNTLDSYNYLLLYIENDTFTGEMYLNGYTGGVDVQITASVPAEVIEPLDEKYLPNVVNDIIDSFDEEIKNNYILLYENSRINKGEKLIGLTVPMPEKEYLVEYDGVEYEVTSWLHNGSMPVIEKKNPDGDFTLFQIYGRVDPQLYTSDPNTVPHSIRVSIKDGIKNVRTVKADALPDDLSIEWDNIKNKPEGVSGEWDDLKNRPFYEAVEETIYLDASVSAGKYNIPRDNFIEVGKEYRIILDDVVYDLVAFSDNGDPTIGEPYNTSASKYEFNEYPFAVYFYLSSICVNLKDTNNTHHICVKEVKNVLKKLDKKFLPDDIGGGSGGGSSNSVDIIFDFPSFGASSTSKGSSNKTMEEIALELGDRDVTALNVKICSGIERYLPFYVRLFDKSELYIMFFIDGDHTSSKFNIIAYDFVFKIGDGTAVTANRLAKLNGTTSF